METKSCEHCGSLNISEDLSTNEITCMKCHQKGKGKMVDTDDVFGKEKIIRKRNIDPFSIQQKIHLDQTKRPDIRW